MKKIILKKSNFWIICLFFLLLLALFWQVFFQGYVFIDGDNFHLNIPLKMLLADAFRQHFFPYWNPYILGGVPYAADLNIGIFNPLNIFFLFFNPARAVTIQVILDLLLIGIFHFFFLRVMSFPKISSALGAIVLMFSGSVFIFSSNVAVLHTIVYIPLVFTASYMLMQTGRLRYIALLIAVQVLQIISGHPQITYYTIFFTVLLLLTSRGSQLRKRIAFVLMYIAFSFLLSCFQTIPFLELVLHSNRPVGSFSYAMLGSLDIAHFIVFIFPTFFGTRLVGNWWGSQATLVGYSGATSIILFMFGVLYGKFNKKRFFLSSLTLSFLLSLGNSGLVAYLFYYAVPGWSLFRSPSMMLVYTAFFSSIFIAAGISCIGKIGKKLGVFGKVLSISSIVFLLPITVFTLLTSNNNQWQKIIQILSAYNIPYVISILFYSASKIQGIFLNALVDTVTFLFILFLTGVVLWKFSKKPFVLSLLLLVIICCDLVYADRTYLQLAPETFYAVPYFQIPHPLAANDYRFYAKQITIKQNRKFFPGPLFFYEESRRNLIGMTDDHSLEHHMLSITGYNSFVLQNYSQLLHSTNITGIVHSNLTDHDLDKLAVKYIFAVNQGKVTIQQRPTALPRLRLLKSGAKANIITSNPNSVVIRVYSPTKNSLILADNYYSGWEVKVNGKKERINVYDTAFRSVNVSPGTSQVIFYYNPIIWKIGVGITLAGLFIFFGVIYTHHRYV